MRPPNSAFPPFDPFGYAQDRRAQGEQASWLPFVVSPSRNQPFVLRFLKETVGFLRTGLSNHER